jgi:putative peptide zinc metalloprotease protein
MLCPTCHRRASEGAVSCRGCGRPLAGAAHPGYDLVLADRTRRPVLGTTTIGRATSSTVRLADRSVSRRHARVTLAGDALVVEDVGSRYGTWIDGERLTGPGMVRGGARLQLGDAEIAVELRRREHESGRTVAVGSAPGGEPSGPALRPGVLVKRLGSTEGARRWVVREPDGERFLRLAGEGELVELLDGRRTIDELIAEAARRLGPDGPAQLVALLTDLADRGLLEGDEPAQGAPSGPRFTRAWTWTDAGRRLDALYARGGWVLFTPAARVVLGALAATGLLAFAYLVLGRYGTPFVVANRVGIGGVVFVVGRLAVAALHETAHGLAMASIGRRVGRAGLKVMLVFPYAFVDTSEAWFASRRRRIAVSAAGPVSDAVVGAVFAWACLVLGAGSLRDICFQLAFGAYVGALVNLNPFVERDGYHMLSDALGEPDLRRRARRVLRREDGVADDAALRWYALAGLAWSVVAAAAAVVVSLRYAPALRALLPAPVVWVLLAAVWAAVLTPAATTLAGPLLDRARARAVPRRHAAG